MELGLEQISQIFVMGKGGGPLCIMGQQPHIATVGGFIEGVKGEPAAYIL